MKHNSDEIVGKYDMKTDNLRKYIKFVEVCDTGYYDCKMRFHTKTLRELNEYFNKYNNTVNRGN